MEKVIEISTISDILKVVNEKNLDCFITDFKGWLELRILAKEVNPDLEKIGIQFEAQDEIFRWVDDGKNDVHLEIKVKK